MSTKEGSASGVGAPLGNDNAVGNSGGGAPFGNSNAVGNSGGGAPDGNTNRKSHGVYCDLDKIDERAKGREAEFIDGIEAMVRDRSNGDLEREPREIPLRLIRYRRAVRDIHHRGTKLDSGRVNPMVSRSRRILEGILNDLGEMGVL